MLIDKRAWIGINPLILPNMKVGKNAIIGANCVVNKDIPDNSIAVVYQQKFLINFNYFFFRTTTVVNDNDFSLKLFKKKLSRNFKKS